MRTILGATACTSTTSVPWTSLIEGVCANAGWDAAIQTMAVINAALAEVRRVPTIGDLMRMNMPRTTKYEFDLSSDALPPAKHPLHRILFLPCKPLIRKV